MSRSPFFFVEKYDSHTNKYELQHPIVWNYDHTKQVCADLYPYNGSHDLFSIVTKEGPGDFPDMKGIHCGLPKDAAEEIKKAYNDCCYETEFAGEKHIYSPNAYWFTYADMYIYCLEHPEVVDYEAMDEAYYNGEEENPPKRIMKPTPLMALKNRVDAFLEVMDELGWQDDYSQIRIVYWIE